jgi:fumarylpyruvate hydrolase
MGSDPTREPPFFFAKPADAIVPSGTAIPYPSRTQDFQHEIELVVAIGLAGRDIARDDALAYVYGYAVGNDYTRRDLQASARREGRPWDVSKGFDASAAVSAIHPVASKGHTAKGRIWLEVNGELRQESNVGELIWSVSEIIAELSTFFTLQPGDLIYTGTPAGVSAVKPGDLVAGGIEGLDTIENRIV